MLLPVWSKYHPMFSNKWVHDYSNTDNSNSKKKLKGPQLKSNVYLSNIKNTYVVPINIYKQFFSLCKRINIFLYIA